MVQNFPGAPNGARKGLKPLMLGLFRREAAKKFWGCFLIKILKSSQNLETPPPLLLIFL